MSEHQKEQERNDQQETDKKKAKRRIIRICTLIFLIILLLLLLFKCSYDYQQPISDNRIEQGVIDIPKDKAQQIVNEAVEQGMFQVFMNTNIKVDSENEANLLIQNSESNHYSAYVEIYNNDKLLYKSETIAPGYKLEQDKLQADLDPGTYDCKAIYHVIDPSTNSEINQVGLSVNLVKENETQ